MDDFISRQAAIETAENVAYAVDEHGSADGWLAMLVNSLEILPSAQPRWIPCEERLPEEQDEYLVTWVTKLHTGKRLVGIGIFEYDLSEDNWLFDDYMKAYVDVTVTAWMPLPEPYAERKEDE